MLDFTKVLSEYKHQQLCDLADSKNTIICLPLELLTKIFGLLGNLELSCTVCGVSRLFHAIASQDRLWESWAFNLEFSKDEINKGKNKEVTIKKIIQLKLFIKEADPLVDKRVKTALEFDMAADPIIYKKDPSQEDKKNFKQLGKELNEKLELSEKINKGFYNHLFLRRIGLSDFDTLKKYAHKLETSYGNNRVWQSVAFEYVRENQLEPVKKILDLFLKKESDMWMIVHRIINKFCSNNQLDKALEFLENRVTSFNPEQLLKAYNLSRFEDVIGTFLNHAEDKKQFDIYESLITKYIPKDKQKPHLMHLVEGLLKEKFEEKAKRLINKYSEEWEKDQDFFASMQLIRIYIQIKNFNQAWILALKNNNKEDNDNHLLHFLRRAFLDANLPDQAEKVNEKLLENVRDEE